MADVATPDSVTANSPNGGGARIGRPPQWTESRSRKLARLYMYTTLPMEKIIKALFPNDDVKKNSAQKTLHKMVGHDPRPLRPVDRNDMNTRFKLLHKRSQRRRRSDGTPIEQGDGVMAGLKEELATPAFSESFRFDDPATVKSPHLDMRVDLASPSTVGSASPGTVCKGLQMLHLRTDPCRVNNAHQTFLHVLSSVWFVGTDDLNVPLYTLLHSLYARYKNLMDDAERIKPITKRLQFLEGLLTPLNETAPPNVNHYDHKGHTVLIAFAAQLSDDQDDKSGQHIGRILDLLVEKGAILDARNRQGETALLVAAKRGNKHVVSKLLDMGANLHARDKCGRAIMAIIDAQIALCSKDLPSYGRLEAVRAAVLAKKLEEKGVEDEPNFLDEWTWAPKRQS
ncbi:putative ankyrin repeat containing protein [Diaporthe ampelina]|uniref:Putative ankyrin repeat containing protein n=1 Tax=Diaporthe ampelina TaxID=1214573 RepID=A0A0G2FD97_9PEZI|nr:putative ankyrin repeat containing protein [Diaporthe ampelina]